MLGILNQIDATGLPASITSNSSVETDYLVWKNLYPVGRSLGITINETFYGSILEYQFNFTGVNSMTDVAQVFQDTINTQGDLVTVSYNTSTNKFTFTTVAVGPTAYISIWNADIGENVHFYTGLVYQEAYGS